MFDTCTGRHARQRDPVRHVRRGDLDVVEDLLALDIDITPLVAVQLEERLGDDLPTIREVAAVLKPAQRCGRRVLPDRLPAVPPIATAFAGMTVTPRERDALLVACLSTQARLDLLLHVAGVSVQEIAGGALADHLSANAGRFALRDPRLAVWMLETTPLVQQRTVHERLERFHEEEGDDVRAAWHRARRALTRQPEVAGILLPVARRLSEQGRVQAAFRVAVEAFDHAEGAMADEARLIAGLAALGAGWVEEAADWLGSLFPSGAPEARSQALPGLLFAETALHGAVPITDPAERRPRGDDSGSWHAWARAAGMAATLSAERGARSAMRVWLAELREADIRAGADGAIRDPVVELCWLLSGEDDDAAASQAATPARGIVAALRSALAGDVDAGLEILATHEANLAQDTDPFLAGYHPSPLVAASRAIVEVTLRLWRGDIALARERLLSAALRYPVAIPFAGLGAVLARRLDLAVQGSQGALARSVSLGLPAGIRPDGLMDQAIEAYLAGSVEEAALRLRLWSDRGEPRPALAVPELDEMGSHDAGEVVEPSEAAAVRLLCRRIRGTAQTAWQREYGALAEEAHAVRSPFARARVEALLGTTCVIRGDRAAGRRHLRLAHSLFEDVGACAWSDAVQKRLTRLGEQIDAVAQPETAPIAVFGLDPMATCRAVWEPLLTERELQVAMLVVEGAANREIAERLDVSIRTVEVHVGRVLAKLDVRSRVELTVLAHRTNHHA